MAPNIFNFISDDLSKVTKTYNNYPMEYEEVIPSTKVDVKPVRTQQDSFNSRTPRNSFRHKPCSSCSFKDFDNHILKANIVNHQAVFQGNLVYSEKSQCMLYMWVSAHF